MLLLGLASNVLSLNNMFLYFPILLTISEFRILALL